MRDGLSLASGQVRQQRRLEPEVRAHGPGRWSGELLEDGELVRRWDDRWHELDGRRERIHPVVIADESDTSPVAIGGGVRRGPSSGQNLEHSHRANPTGFG